MTMRTIRPATKSDTEAIDAAAVKLREARDLLRLAGAPRAVQTVARALKSADGARRHVGHRIHRSAAATKPHSA